ncbi:MAG: ABC transporter ATP-binding protein [Pseudomonadota bacterium]
MSTLSAMDISFGFGSHEVLQKTSFGPLQPGKLSALIGPNAAGKSTLFRVVAGLLKASGGTVQLGETNLDHLSSRNRLKRVCFMPQFFAANAALTVFDVVMMAHKQLRGWKVSGYDMNAVGQALQATGIGHLSEAYVSELSGGQSQLVSIAQALIRKSDVYLFDEPTSALDLRHQLTALKLIKDGMVKRNAVGLVAMHDLNLAARFADHLVLMGSGQVHAQGSPHDVLNSGAISEIYGVDIEVTTGPREDLLVHAYAS